MHQPRLHAFALALALALGAASGCDRKTHAEQVCEEVVQVVATAWVRCGYDGEAKAQDVLFELRNCENVVRIRDETALRDECFPALQTLDCTALEDDQFPAPCLDQIKF